MKHFLRTHILLIMLLLFLSVSFSGISTTAGAPVNAFTEKNASGSLTLVDCRNKDHDSASARKIMQVINNELHVWNEHIDPANQTKCLYLVEPYKKALQAGEAAELLALSRQWEQQAFSPAPDNHTASARSRIDHIAGNAAVYSGTTTLENGDSLVLQQEEMEDDRTPVDNKYALTYPYNNIGFLNVDFPNSFMRSTAFLIGPNLALTNAHNIYSPELGGWYNRIEFSAAQYETEWPDTVKPYSTKNPVHVETNDKFYQYENDEDRDMAVKYDYAALFFEEPYSEITTFMPIEFNHIPDQVLVIGYPGYVRDNKTNGLWKSEGSLIDYNEYCLYYDAYTTGGNSGSPVIVYRPEAGTYRVAAIHAFASPGYFSGGPHFNIKNQPIIEKWLETASEHITNEVTSISLNKSSLTMQKGEQEALVVTTTPDYLDDLKLTWVSSSPDVAGVTADGIVTALKAGETVITVSTEDGKLEAGCTVKVEPSAEENTGMEVNESGLGDLNDDQVINVLDVIMVLQHVLEINSLDQETVLKADVNQNGRIDVLDATLMMQYALGLIESF